MNKKHHLTQSQAGFSLMEILIVLALIALGGTFVVNKLMDRLDEGNVQAVKIQMSGFKQLMEDYRRYCNQYPTSDQGLEALLTKPSTGSECPNYPASGFLDSKKVPMDPWGRPYMYESDGKSYNIISLGKDGKEGGEGAAADIKSADL